MFRCTIFLYSRDLVALSVIVKFKCKICITQACCTLAVFSVVMAYCGLNHACCIITARACVISIPTNLSASGIFCFKRRKIVTFFSNFVVCRILTTRACVIILPTDLSTRRSFCFMMCKIMAGRYFYFCCILTTRACVISSPTILGASRCLSLIMG